MALAARDGMQHCAKLSLYCPDSLERCQLLRCMCRTTQRAIASWLGRNVNCGVRDMRDSFAGPLTSTSCLTAESTNAGEVQKVMEGVARLSVPLKVNVSFGTKWGSMKAL